MKRLTFISYFILTLTIGCKESNTEDDYADSLKPVFNLQEDLFDFSSKLTESDTLQILANLSVCTSERHEKNILTKKGNDILITTYAEGEFVTKEDEQLETTKYDFLQNDTLNFENLFRLLHDKNVKDEPNNSPVFAIVHKLDTVHYYPSGLSDLIHLLEFYRQIQYRLHPTVEMYQPIIPPEPELPLHISATPSLIDE